MMDHKPLPAAGTSRDGAARPARGSTSRPGRRHHPAARSRVVAGVLSAVLFLGLGAGMAVDNASVTTALASGSTSTTEASSDSSQADTGSGSTSWAATAGSSSEQSPVTSSQGS